MEEVTDQNIFDQYPDDSHIWQMMYQTDNETHWTCQTHDPPCHMITFDGNGMKAPGE